MAKILRILTALAAVTLLALLAWHCLDIYYGSESSSLEELFNYGEVSFRLQQLMIPFVTFILLAVSAWMVSKTSYSPIKSKRISFSHRAATQKAALPVARQAVLRWVLFLAGSALILWGALNGSLYDVLVKSINICTECIGLG